MTFGNSADQVIESFNRGNLPCPYEFTNAEIEAIAAIPGIDSYGTFTDAPLEQELIYNYNLNVDDGENTWSAFAKMLRAEKSPHYWRFSSRDKELALRYLNNAIAECLTVGIDRDQISEQLEFI